MTTTKTKKLTTLYDVACDVLHTKHSSEEYDLRIISLQNVCLCGS